MAGKAKRTREPFEVGEVVNLADLRAERPKTPASRPERKPRTTKRAKREPKVTKKRKRRKGRKNETVDVTSFVEGALRTEQFFEIAESFKLPDGKRGPAREYSEFMVLLWELLMENFDSIHDMAAHFSHRLIWNHVVTTLEQAWPHQPDRRVPTNRPMSRSQFCRHRAQLEKHNPGAADEAIEKFTQQAIVQSIAMGCFPTDQGSLSKPHATSIVSGDGTIIAAATDNIEGDLVVDEDGVAQQARYDPTARLNGKDETKAPFPAFNFAHLQVADPEHEQERVILTFGRADELGEAQTLEQLLEPVQAGVPHLRHYCYDMVVQGATIERLYRRGLSPIVKVPRNKKGEPASALIETRTIKGHSGREHTVQIWALDGPAGIKTPVGGDEFFVRLTPRIQRQPRIGTHQGFYEFPDHPLVHADLRGREIMIRLDGTTDDGRNRAQYLRWFNEHTEIGRERLGLREGTESEHAVIRRTLPWNRARSFGEFRVKLDLLGYFFGRNLRAALAHERRTGINPLHTGPPPQVATAAAA